jgi:hypothetical protein
VLGRGADAAQRSQYITGNLIAIVVVIEVREQPVRPASQRRTLLPYVLVAGSASLLLTFLSTSPRSNNNSNCTKLNMNAEQGARRGWGVLLPLPLLRAP